MTYASTEDIKSHLDSLQEDSDSIEQQCIDVSYHMKGVTWNEVWGMSPEQRSKIIKNVNKIYKDREEAQTGKKHM